MVASPPEPVDLERLRTLLVPRDENDIGVGRAVAALNALPALIAELTALRAVRDAAKAVLPEVMEQDLGSVVAADFDASIRVFQAKADRWTTLRAALDAVRPKP